MAMLNYQTVKLQLSHDDDDDGDDDDENEHETGCVFFVGGEGHSQFLDKLANDFISVT